MADADPSLFRPLGQAGRSNRDQLTRQHVKQARQQQRTAEAMVSNPHATVKTAERAWKAQRAKPTRFPVTSLTRAERLAMASSLQAKFYRQLMPDPQDAEARGQHWTASAVKNLTTAYAICEDKVNGIMGRPAEATASVPEPVRDAVLALGSKLAAISASSQAPAVKAAESEG